MKMRALAGLGLAGMLLSAGAAGADQFGTGDNQFTIDFVTITANPGVTRSTNTSGDTIETFTAGAGVSDYTDPGYDYRIGVYETTNDQWNKFRAELAPVPVTGDPTSAYDRDPSWTGTNVPTNEVSWYEAAQFVNWLNTSTGHHAAYKFTGTQGTSGYALDTWSAAEANNGTNLYRHKDAFYYLPTEDEWLKAGYWDGTDIQRWTTPDGTQPVEDVEANYDNESGAQPWDVGTGAKELNGTFDMMGNAWEWTESPYSDRYYGTNATRGVRSGSYFVSGNYLASSSRVSINPSSANISFGFRVASEVPEPCSLVLLSLGGLALAKRRRR